MVRQRDSDAKPPESLSSFQPYVWDADNVWRDAKERRMYETQELLNPVTTRANQDPRYRQELERAPV